MRPSKEEQDIYFRQNQLDPWGYDTPFVKERLSKSLAFVQRFVAPDFDGVFVEVGAFNGKFTHLLTSAFPEASVAASDLIKAAWEANHPFPESVSFQWCDMADFQLPQEHKGKRAILLALECLYYMTPEEQNATLQILIGKINPELIFISGPLGDQKNGRPHDGEYYFDEEILRGFLPGFAVDAITAVTTNQAFSNLYPWNGDWLVSAIGFVAPVWRRGANKLYAMRGDRLHMLKDRVLNCLDTERAARSKFARQVAYCFRRQ